MMDVRLLSLLLLHCRCFDLLSVTRKLQDEVRVDQQTCFHMEGVYTDGTCLCPLSKPFVASRSSSGALACLARRDMGCDVLVGERLRQFLLLGYYIPPLDGGCRRIKSIAVWNVLQNGGSWTGTWDNVTFSQLIMFNLHHIGNGHLLKLRFRCNRCAVLKLSGKLSLPFNVSALTWDGRRDVVRPSLKVRHPRTSPADETKRWGASGTLLVILTVFLFLSVVGLICQFR